jgi:hypothetical protein
MSVSATAALAGTRGMSVLIDDTRALYVANRAKGKVHWPSI